MLKRIFKVYTKFYRSMPLSALSRHSVATTDAKIKYSKHTGFTLIEIIIALFIFAIIGVIAAISLRNSINNFTKIKKANSEVAELSYALTILERDSLQAFPRSVSDEDGHLIGPFIATGSNSFEMTVGGYYNPLQLMRRSQLQRVKYSIEDSALVRTTWPVLDRAPSTKPLMRKLLSNVSSMQVQFVDPFGQTQASWPPPTNSNDANLSALEILPKAIMVDIKTKNWGDIQRIFVLPGAMYVKQN